MNERCAQVIHSFDESFEFIWALAGRVHASHQATHAVSGDIVNGNVVRGHSDVGQPERTTAFKRNPDRQPIGSLWSALGTAMNGDTITVNRASPILKERK